jgi:SAM-dependent methyltransferase
MNNNDNIFMVEKRGGKSALKSLLRALSFMKPLLEFIASIEARLAEAWAFSAYHRLYLIQWGMWPAPEFVMHKIDLFWHWRATRRSHWVERGVYSTLAIKPGARVLELGCGDGFNTYSFYSSKASKVVALDFDSVPLNYARRVHAAPNIEYRWGDMRTQMPEGDFDNVIWDAVFMYITEEEGHQAMQQIKRRLSASRGILSGHTPLAEFHDDRWKSPKQVNECRSKEDLHNLLRPHFDNITIFETLHPDRRNLYFWASDGVIPFADDWHGQITSSKADT